VEKLSLSDRRITNNDDTNIPLARRKYRYVIPKNKISVFDITGFLDFVHRPVF
jgi:hypothetical protein